MWEQIVAEVGVDILWCYPVDIQAVAVNAHHVAEKRGHLLLLKANSHDLVEVVPCLYCVI